MQIDSTRCSRVRSFAARVNPMLATTMRRRKREAETANIPAIESHTFTLLAGSHSLEHQLYGLLIFYGMGGGRGGTGGICGEGIVICKLYAPQTTSFSHMTSLNFFSLGMTPPPKSVTTCLHFFISELCSTFALICFDFARMLL